MTLIFLLPIISAVSVFWLEPREDRLPFLALLALPILSSLLLLPVIAFLLFIWIPYVLVSGTDRSFERLRTERIGQHTVAVYRTNGGAMTDFGIVVRSERTIIPGLMWVNHLCDAYPANAVVIERTSPATIRCTFPPYGDRDAFPMDVALTE